MTLTILIISVAVNILMAIRTSRLQRELRASSKNQLEMQYPAGTKLDVSLLDIHQGDEDFTKSRSLLVLASLECVSCRKLIRELSSWEGQKVFLYLLADGGSRSVDSMQFPPSVRVSYVDADHPLHEVIGNPEYTPLVLGLKGDTIVSADSALPRLIQQGEFA